MSGSWERLKYDEGTYEYEVQKDNKTANYMVNVPRSCNPCRAPEPGNNAKQGVSLFPDRSITDVESDLKNLSRRHTKDPKKQYKPYCPEMSSCGEGFPCGGGVVKGCDNSQPKLRHLETCGLNPVETRTTHPPCTLRGTGWDRFESLCINPQDRGCWEHPGEVRVSYRLVVKDNHKPCIPQMEDPLAAWPKGGDSLPCDPIMGNSCSSFTGSLRPNRFDGNPLD